MRLTCALRWGCSALCLLAVLVDTVSGSAVRGDVTASTTIPQVETGPEAEANQQLLEATQAGNLEAANASNASNLAASNSSNSSNSDAVALTNQINEMALAETRAWQENQTATRSKEAAEAAALEASSKASVSASETSACKKLRADNPDDAAAIAKACDNRDSMSINIGLHDTPHHLNKPRRAGAVNLPGEYEDGTRMASEDLTALSLDNTV